MKIVELSIKNFRGIKSFKGNFSEKNFVCLVGRGDAGKSTILEAIARVLSPRWNLSFYDNDFYECNIKEPIEIEASVVDFPEELLQENKYGLYQRWLKKVEIIDDIYDENTNNGNPVLTIKLEVKDDLEPSWTVVNKGEQEPKTISAKDRAKMNVFMISDYMDNHFSWGKGSLLSALLKAEKQLKTNNESGEELKDKLLQALRDTKAGIDDVDFKQFNEIAENVVKKVSGFGLSVSKEEDTITSIDLKDLVRKDGLFCLHESNVPFRLKGKGSKRLLSIAMQMMLTEKENAGITLIDEVEQGLEPDRVKQLVKTLSKSNSQQVFITTHSREVITELKCSEIAIVQKKSNDYLSTTFINEVLQGVVRACPEAFFAKKVIVCEGATEVGICRALDTYRKDNDKKNMAFEGCVVVDGKGNSFVSYAQRLNKLGFDTLVFCDSDDENIKKEKDSFKHEGIKVIDCEKDNAIEQQIFKDLPHEGIKELIEYALKDKYDGNEDSLRQSVNSRYSKENPKENLPDNWKEIDTPEIRKALAEAAIGKKTKEGKKPKEEEKSKAWFKRIDHGEEGLGKTIFKYFDKMENDNPLKKQLKEMSDWIDRDDVVPKQQEESKQ